MWLQWNLAALIAAVLVAAVVFTRPNGRQWLVVARAFAKETALILSLYAIWQLAGTLSVMQVNGARGRGQWIWDAQRFLHFPSELTFQKAALPHPLIVQFFNGYYAIMHVPALVIFLIWLFVRHRDRYAPVRNAIALLTGICLVIQMIPVAPPRMFPALGFVDTAKLYGQSVYGAVGSGLADQLSAMPSVHVGWAVAVGLFSVQISRSRWRWLALLHPVLTVLAITVTANHWWLDGVVAVAILLLVMAAQHGVKAALRRYPARQEVSLEAQTVA
jgi:hypothetical protein